MNQELKVRFEKDFGSWLFGKMKNKKLHDRGIRIYSDGNIYIRYWNNGVVAPGNYLIIWPDGKFRVGECYLKNGKRCER